MILPKRATSDLHERRLAETARATARESDGDEAGEQRACHASITNLYHAHTRYVSNYKHFS
jgi:hypothetical protein